MTGARTDTPSGPSVWGVVVDDDVAAGLEPLGLLEVGQHVAVRPALRAASGPGVEVAGVAPHVGHVVDARRAAQHLAARHHHPALGQPAAGTAGVGGVHPVGLGVQLQRRHRCRHQFLGRRWAARLDQRHAYGRILGQPRGDHRTGRSCSDDDDIELLGHPVRLPGHVRAGDRVRRSSSALTPQCGTAHRSVGSPPDWSRRRLLAVPRSRPDGTTGIRQGVAPGPGALRDPAGTELAGPRARAVTVPPRGMGRGVQPPPLSSHGSRPCRDGRRRREVPDRGPRGPGHRGPEYPAGAGPPGKDSHDGSVHRLVVHHNGKVLADEEWRGE